MEIPVEIVSPDTPTRKRRASTKTYADERSPRILGRCRRVRCFIARELKHATLRFGAINRPFGSAGLGHFWDTSIVTCVILRDTNSRCAHEEGFFGLSALRGIVGLRFFADPEPARASRGSRT